jgi:hypothetical protein
MDRSDLLNRARFLYRDELQYALAREEKVDTDAVIERATLRLTREMEGQEIYELVHGLMVGVRRNVDREFVLDVYEGQLKIEGALRVGNSTLVSMKSAREEDWLAFDAIRETKFREHAAKRAVEREFIHEQIIPRLRAHGGSPTTFEACPDLFAVNEAA